MSMALCNVFPISYFNSFFKNTFAVIKITVQRFIVIKKPY